jgi:hypothetical protein
MKVIGTETQVKRGAKGLSVFEKYLTLWVGLCIAAGIVLGKVAPGAATFLDGGNELPFHAWSVRKTAMDGCLDS